MSHYKELAAFHPRTPVRAQESIADKIAISRGELARYASVQLIDSITEDSFVDGEVPRLSIFDDLPKGTQLVELTSELTDFLTEERNYDLISWNTPEAFLRRLRVGYQEFEAPVDGESHVMDRLNTDRRVVSFEDLRIAAPVPDRGRHSRKQVHSELEEHNIMGMARLPLGMGSVPDVGSVLGYLTVAQAGCMAFVARDKVLSSEDHQATVVERVIDTLRTIELPPEMLPQERDLQEFWQITERQPGEYSSQVAKDRYIEALRDSWVANVGAAIEASPKGITRAQKLYEAGCRLFRIYSPEGGREIVDQVKEMKRTFGDDPKVKIVAGQLMDRETAKASADSGADAIIIGVAGGSQCTTSQNAGIPVNTPNLLYDLRGSLEVPIGIEGGGVGNHLMAAYALGASFLLKPGEIGMSIEGAGGRYMLQDPEKNYWMLYGGEASDASKWWRDLVDDLGRPEFVEGEKGVRMLPQDRYSMTRNIRKLRQQIAIGLVFQRAGSIAELHQRDCSNIREVTNNAGSLSVAYGR